MGPLEAVVHAEASNHPRLLRLRGVVVSASGKRPDVRFGQVRFAESNESEPLMRCRNSMDDVKPGVDVSLGMSAGGRVYCPGGIRHKGGENADQALVRNVGTCHSDAKGKPQAEAPRGGTYRSGIQGRSDP